MSHDWCFLTFRGVAIAGSRDRNSADSKPAVRASYRACAATVGSPSSGRRRAPAPLPEVGQASTVFSLTALFGAYFGIYIFLGLPALAGVACGTVLGLFVIRNWIQKHHFESFE